MTPEATQHFLIGIAADATDFMRHQCPRCGLDFKLKCEPIRQHDSLSWWLERTVREAQANVPEEETPSTGKAIYCPYCQHAGRGQAFVHPEVVGYIRRIARREIVEPAIAKMFQRFASGARSSKYVKVTVSGPSGRSPRPISGPEADDQLAVRCLPCGELFKVDERWRGFVTCPGCSASLLPQ